MARILIRTPLHEIPRSPIVVAVDGKIFHIRVREEVEDLEEDFEEWSSEDVMEEEGESDYEVESSESDQEDSISKDFEDSGGNPPGVNTILPACHSGVNSII
ncbi:hypothetical protein ACS0TY_017014 [Phlomoides rotata]